MGHLYLWLINTQLDKEWPDKWVNNQYHINEIKVAVAGILSQPQYVTQLSSHPDWRLIAAVYFTFHPYSRVVMGHLNEATANKYTIRQEMVRQVGK